MPRLPKRTVGPSDDRDIPSEYIGQLTPTYHCLGWNAKRQKYCKNRAGAKTDHLGVGRCAFHGGRSGTLKHGRYSTILTMRIGELIAEHQDDKTPLDVHPELATARALVQDFIERTADDPNAAGLAEAIKLLDRIVGMVESIERIKAQNAISPKDFNRLMTNMGLVVRQFVSDDETCRKIQDGWLALRV